MIVRKKNTEKTTCQIKDFAVPADLRVKLKYSLCGETLSENKGKQKDR